MNESEFRKQAFTNNWNLKNSKQLISSRYQSISQIIIKLDFTFNGAVAHSKHIERTFKPSDHDYFKIDCINPECINSDLDLSEEIRDMVYKGSSLLQGRKVCNGYQDYERFRSKGSHCLAEMEFEILIEYKNNS